MPKNIIQHHEWTTRDPKQLKAFYGRIFDWKFREAMPGYTMIDDVGGFYEAADAQMPTGIINYINVKSIDETEAKIKAAGGKIYKSKQEVPNMGWFSIFADPDGNTLAIWEARPSRSSASAKKKTSKKKAAKKAPAKKSRTAKKKR